MGPRSRLPLVVFAALLAFAVGQGLHFDALLPARVASHFDAAGTPNGFAPKEVLLRVHAIAVGLLALVGGGLPFLLRVLPPRAMNLPRKEYWLAPERVEWTIEFLVSHQLWFGCALLGFIDLVMYRVFSFNLQPPGGPGPSLLGPLVAFLLFVFLWMGRMLWTLALGKVE